MQMKILTLISAWARVGGGGGCVCTCACGFVREGVCLLYLGVCLVMKIAMMMMVCVQR